MASDTSVAMTTTHTNLPDPTVNKKMSLVTTPTTAAATIPTTTNTNHQNNDPASSTTKQQLLNQHDNHSKGRDIIHVMCCESI